MPLTDAACRTATCSPKRRRERFTDSGGLYLEVAPNGSRRWFWKYSKDGKESRLALGSYPAVSLAVARKSRDAARMQKDGGIDPVQARKLVKLRATVAESDTFRAVAEEWFGKHKVRWSNHYAIRELRNLQKDLFPYLGERRLADVEPVELLAVLRRVEDRGALDVAHRVLTTARAVWRYGVATGRVPRDATADLKGALTPHKGRHFAAIIDPKAFGALIRTVRIYQGGPVVRAALQLAPMLFPRPGELRGMAWAELDLDAGLWTVPSARMKRSVENKRDGDPHTVPLPRQAVVILRDLHPLSGRGTLVFPGERDHDRPISDNTLRAALATLGYGPERQSVHGFRASARTMLAEVLDFDPLVIEAQLAHTVKDANGRAYNRTQFLQRRIPMMQAWADFLDRMAVGGDVVPLRPAA
jgi:integrase